MITKKCRAVQRSGKRRRIDRANADANNRPGLTRMRLDQLTLGRRRKQANPTLTDEPG